MAKPLDQRICFFLIFLAGCSLILWCYLFRLFFNGNESLQGDAYSYLGHFQFYIENIVRGVYPLWNPFEQYYNINEFFLRRIGEFNPFYWTIALLNKCGLPFLTAYLVFMAMYFLLGIIGFYLLSWKLFSDHVASFTAALLLLFSCIGTSIFESYLLLEIVPLIWFFYFCVAFMLNPRKIFFLGAIFCLMLIDITYIPFFFYTILFVFLSCFFAVFPDWIGVLYRQTKDFIGRHQIFTCLCIVLLVFSFVPGYLWYRQTSQAEVLMGHRHTGSKDINSSTVSIEKIDEGGIIPDLIFDRMFVDLDRVGLHDFYISLFAFLMLFAGLWGRLNRRLVFFFIFGFIFFLIGLADASFVHGILYKYVPFFNYFRNIQFFLQFAILPVFILFVVEQMQIFIEDCKHPSLGRTWMTLWVTAVHMGAIVLFLHHHVIGMTYAAIILSLGWMLCCIWSKLDAVVWVLLLWGAIVLQPFEVYGRIAADHLTTNRPLDDVEYNLQLPSATQAAKITNLNIDAKTNIYLNDLPYFGTRWLYEIIGSVDINKLKNYLRVPFIVYDHLSQVHGRDNYERLQTSLARFENVAFVYSDPMQGNGSPGLSKARVITADDQDFKVLKFDANDVIARTAFTSPVFLVRTQYYHSQWKAFIDGKPAPLMRTNVCVQGLWVPAGEHVVHWRFGSTARHAWAYFLEVLYPLVLGWLIWLWLYSKMSSPKLSI